MLSGLFDRIDPSFDVYIEGELSLKCEGGKPELLDEGGGEPDINAWMASVGENPASI